MPLSLQHLDRVGAVISVAGRRRRCSALLRRRSIAWRCAGGAWVDHGRIDDQVVVDREERRHRAELLHLVVLAAVSPAERSVSPASRTARLQRLVDLGAQEHRRPAPRRSAIRAGSNSVDRPRMLHALEVLGRDERRLAGGEDRSRRDRRARRCCARRAPRASRRGSRRASDVGMRLDRREIGHVVRDQRRAHLGDRGAPLEVDADAPPRCCRARPAGSARWLPSRAARSRRAARRPCRWCAP